MSLRIQQMFAQIAKRYDLINDILSLGIHRLWKKQTVQAAAITQGQTVLDVCCGTGDLSFLLAQAVGPQGSVTGIDFVEEMITIARSKQSVRNLSSQQLTFIQADALNLPLADRSVDVITIAFGIRNVDDLLGCLTEFRRVLKLHGKLLVLEFGQPKIPVFTQLYKFYSKYLMPQIGGFISGNRQAYDYLPQSASLFPCGKNFEKLLLQAGFGAIRTKKLTGGVAFLYISQNVEAIDQGTKYENSR